MEKQTILMVHNYYQIGGGEHTVFENEVAMLRKNGHKVITYTRSNDELKTSKWKLLMTPISTIWSWKTYLEVRVIIQKEKIDIVHCHNTFPLISPSVYYAARSLKIPVLQTMHNFRFLCPNGLFFCENQICEACNEQWNFRKALGKGCYRNSRIQTLSVVLMLKFHRLIGTYKKISYIFLTDFNRRKFAKLIDIDGENVFIKPNFVSDNTLMPRQEIKKTFVFAGRLDEYKGIRFVLEAWKSMPEDYVLHIYGDGDLRPAVEEAVRKYDNVQFFGFQPKERIMQDISNCIASLVPSLCYETFGLVVAESFQMGCPVVTTNFGNPERFIVESRAGVVYAPGDVTSFCQAIDDVIRNNNEYSENAKIYYENNLSECANYLHLKQIYDSVFTRSD